MGLIHLHGLLLVACTVICLSGVCYGAVRNDVCGDSENCTDGTTCINGTCFCDLDTHYYLNSICSSKLGLGTECPSGYTSAEGSVCADVNAECGDSGTGIDCVCKDTHYNNGGTCTLKIAFNGSCGSANQCITTDAVCSSQTCQCDTITRFYYSTSDACLQKNTIALDGACPSEETSTTNTYCSDNNARCNGVTCQCMTNYFPMNSACVEDKTLQYDVSCPVAETDNADVSVYCEDPNVKCLSATSGGLKCLCRSGYFRNGATCIEDKTLQYDVSCPVAEADNADVSVYCEDPNVKCLSATSGGSKCLCRSGYFRHGGTCIEDKTLQYDVSCPVAEADNADVSVYCEDPNVKCLSATSGGLKCLCRSGYFRNGATCIEDKTLQYDVSCPVAEADNADVSVYCEDPNVKCLSATSGGSKCLCRSGYFRHGGTCIEDKTLQYDVSCPVAEADNADVSVYCEDPNVKCLSATSGGSKCLCRSGYFRHGGTCIEDKTLQYDVSCPVAEADNADVSVYCEDPNVKCLSATSGGSKCLCRSGYFRHGGTCIEDKTLQYDVSCPVAEADNADVSVYCEDPNVKCLSATSGGSKCLCRSGYFRHGGTCIEDKTLQYDVSCPVAEADNADVSVYCEDPNVKCLSATSGGSKCLCRSGYFRHGGTCIEDKTLQYDVICPVAEADNADVSVYCEDPNVKCLSATGGGLKCLCRTGYFRNDATCIGVNSIILNGDCPGYESPSNPTEYCWDMNARCSINGTTNRCLCRPGYFVHNGVCTLERSIGLGDTCPGQEDLVISTTYCSDPNARCNRTFSSYTCMCLPSHYDSNNAMTIGGTCETKVGLGESCPQPDACGTTDSVCTSGTCLCATTHYDDDGLNVTGGQCVLKVDLGYQCPQPDACYTSNALCSGGSCKCSANYYDTNTNNNNSGTCRLRKTLDSNCDSGPNVKQCYESTASCRSSSSNGLTTCQCDAGYYQDGQQCIPNKALGESCGECSDINADCFEAICRCDVGYYDDNGSTSSGTCKPVDELGVTGITFPLVENTQLEVSWSAPSVAASMVSEYVVEWRPKGNNISGDSQHVGASSTGVSINGLTAGKAYTITVTTVNSEAGYNRSTSSIKFQATKPYPPPSLDVDNSNFSVDNNRILIAWEPPNGEVSGYSVQLFGESMLVGDAQTSSRMTNITGSNAALKHGYTYVVKILSKSEEYDNGQTVESNIVSTNLKTVVQAPGAPTSVQCVNSEAESIMLTWTAPTLPNGDLRQYIIKVKIRSKVAIVAEHSTASTNNEFKVTGLTSGTSYSFDVYTENELYNSSSAGSTQQYCSTKAKKSEKPSDVQIVNITSRTIQVSWNSPAKLYAEENLGYLVIIKPTETMSCQEEVYYKCNNCVQLISELQKVCSPSNRRVIEASAGKLKDESFTYTFVGLLPDTIYEISISAINNIGPGDTNITRPNTSEEEPQKPSQPQVDEMRPTSFRVSWDLADPRPGKVTYTVYVSADPSALSKTLTTSGFTNTSLTVSGLEEYWGYVVQVTAATSVGSTTSDVSDIVTTLTAAPGVVDQFQVTSAPGGNYTQIQVSWRIPSILERNSEIKQFVFKHNTSSVTAVSKTIIRNSDDAYDYTEQLTVTPEQYYSFEVYAVNEQDEIGASSSKDIMAPPGVPISFIDETVTKVVQMQEVQETQISLRIYTDFLDQTTYGAIRETGLIGCASSLCKLSDFANMPLSDFQSMDNWQKAKDKGYSTYRITKASWLDDTSTQVSRRRRSIADTIPFTVGTEGCSADEYCNGPLKADTEYIIVVVTCTNGGCLLSEQYGPFKTKAVPPEVPVGLIVGVVVGVVVVAAVVAAVVFLVVRRRRLGSPMKHIKDEEPEFDITETKNIPRKRPICLNNFEGYIKDLHKDSNLKFSAEYEELKDLSPKHPCLNSDLEENRAKNRYINIIPFDHTRVKLLASGESDTEDYINANYLPGYSSPREYIGCQGPLPGTIDDFWRMTWEQNVHVIVMLTLCKEGNKIKCEQYWPTEVNDPKQFGDVVVEVSSYSSMKTYDYRMFKLTVQGKTRVVKHFHFLTWQDFQANVRHDIILDFIRSVRSHIQPPDTVGPAIIHCSAGVGRTGTYIALDHLMQFINDHDFHVDVDIFDLVLKMRENRSFMVQTEQQYIFIHDCVKEMLEDKRRKEESIYENQGVQVGENIYANSENEQSLYENWQSGSVQKTVL